MTTIKQSLTNRIDELHVDAVQKELIPSWFVDNTVFTFIGGAHHYDVASEESDTDVYNVVVPPATQTLSTSRDDIIGFDPEPKVFETFLLHDFVPGWDLNFISLPKLMKLLQGGKANSIEYTMPRPELIIKQTPYWPIASQTTSLMSHFSTKRLAKCLLAAGIGELKKSHSVRSKGTHQTARPPEKTLSHGGRMIAQGLCLIRGQDLLTFSDYHREVWRAKNDLAAYNYCRGLFSTWADEGFAEVDSCSLPEEADRDKTRTILKNLLTGFYDSSKV